MAKYVFDPKKNPPASGSRQDYIKPGEYKFKITKYDDKASQAGNDMHTFNFEVISKDEKGKRITDWFVMPKTRKDSDVGVRRLNALIIAAVQPKTNKAVTVDLKKLIKKELTARVRDERQEASKGTDGKEYPARTVSRLDEYVDPRAADDDEEDEEEDTDDDDDTDDEEEEEEEAPKKKAKAKAKAAPKKAAKKSSKKAAKDDEDDDDDDFSFDDDEDEEEEDDEDDDEDDD